MEKTIRNILVLFLFVLIIYLMSTLSVLLIPLVLAILFALLFQPVVMLLKKIKMPTFLILPIISVFSLGILYLVAQVIAGTVNDIISQGDYLISQLSLRLDSILHFVYNITGYEMKAGELLDELTKDLDKDWIQSTAGSVAGSVTSFSGSLLIFTIYYIVLLAGIPRYKEYIAYVGGTQGDKLLKQYEKVQKSVVSYMIIKTLISIATGIVAFVICTLFGIKFAVFWGFLTFLLNFIPSIGSISATIPPILMGIIQYDSFGTVILLMLCLSSMQFVIGNIIEPKIMGHKLKLNTLTVIFGLVFWGYIWGIAGMILSVPLLVILKLILEQFPDISIFARIMGSAPSNEINEDFEDNLQKES